MNARDICIYCFESGCSNDTVHHAKFCPMRTNIYPVTEEDVTNDLKCPACAVKFALGEYYTTRKLNEYDGDVLAVVCLTCAAYDRVIP